MKQRGYMPKSKSDHHLTPPDLVRAVHRAFGGPPDLDPCSQRNSVVGATSTYQPPTDGLALPWGEAGSKVFVNPPFSKVDAWVARCRREGTGGRHVILLMKAATETYRWQLDVERARVVCFLNGRVWFLRPNGKVAKAACPFPVAMVAWNTPGFEDAFRQEGSLWVPVR